MAKQATKKAIKRTPINPLKDGENDKSLLSEAIEKQTGEVADLVGQAEKVKESVKNEIETYKTSFNAIEINVKKEISDAEIKLKEIEDRVRKVVSEQAIQEAQKEFEEASNRLSKQIWIWVILSAISIFCGFCFAIKYLVNIPFVYKDFWGWKQAFQTSVRLIVLTGIWTISAFFIKMFRAYLQMYHQNLHRKRIANSMSSFIDGSSEHQRDILLSKLVDSITDFGNPGIIKDTESKAPTNNIIENITKVLGDQKK